MSIGGAVDEGESVVSAALRELREETGIVAVEVSLAGLEPAEVGNVLHAAWWRPEALAVDGTGASPDLPEIMSAAIAAVGGET